jgi:hypothetical protein
MELDKSFSSVSKETGLDTTTSRQDLIDTQSPVQSISPVLKHMEHKAHHSLPSSNDLWNA